MPQSTSEVWIQKLVAAVPRLKPLYDEHLADYDELLPHVLLGDIARYVTQGFGGKEGGEPYENCRGVAVEVLRILEEAVEIGDPELLELVAVSFLENINWSKDGGPQIRSAMGPRLHKEVSRRENL